MIAAALLLLHLGHTAPTLVTPVGFSAQEPQIASVGSQVYVVCGAGDRLYVTRSDNGGAAFGIPVPLPTAGRLALGMRRGPRIVAFGKEVVVSAVYGKAGGGSDGDLFSWRSRDGKVWQGPVIVNDVPGSAREGLHAMAVSPIGKIGCVWLDLREGKTQIWQSSSTDGGTTWTKNSRVYQSPDGTVCECCHPSVAFGPKGEMFVMFRNWLGGSRDMYLTKSTNGGKSFGPALKLGRGTWPLNACPMDGGAVAVADDGRVITAWRRESTVYLAEPGKPEQKVGDGTQPWVAIGQNGPTVVWQNQGKLQGWKDDAPLLSFGEGRNPAIASSAGAPFATWADSAGRVWIQRL